MCPADARFRRVVELYVLHSSISELRDPLLCILPKLADLAKFNRLRRTRLCAGRLQSNFLPVITEGALERPAVTFVTLDNSERASDHAISAAVTNVRLNEDAAEFRAHNRARGTRLEAPSILAMFANVRRKRPRIHLRSVATKPRFRCLLHKLHMPPGLGADCTSVVVLIPAPVQTIFADSIPLLACDLASLAADAQRRVC